MPISAIGSDLVPSHREGRLGEAERGWVAVERPTPARALRESPLSQAEGERGFTLIELMVVLVIVALASAAVAVSLPSGSAGLRQEATAFAARAVAARNAAIVSGRPVRVAADAGGYRIEERRGGRWSPWGGKTGRQMSWDRGTVAAVDGAVAFDSTGLSQPALLRIERSGKAIDVRVSADGSVRVEG